MIKIGQVAEEESARAKQQEARAQRPLPCRIPHGQVPEGMPTDWRHKDNKFAYVDIMDPDEALGQNIIRLMLKRFAADKQRQDWLAKRPIKGAKAVVTTNDTLN